MDKEIENAFVSLAAQLALIDGRIAALESDVRQIAETLRQAQELFSAVQTQGFGALLRG